MDDVEFCEEEKAAHDFQITKIVLEAIIILAVNILIKWSVLLFSCWIKFHKIHE